MTTLVESGESVLLAGWHREVYEIWQKRFDRANVKWGMITGSESASAKEKAKQQFIQGEIKVLMLQLRSGAEIPGLLGDVTRLLRRTRFTGVSEDDHQGALPVALELEGFGFEREVRLDERNRIDFLVTRDTEEVGIEVKITSRSKSAVYAQVRRYAACGLSELVLVAPWSAVPDFEVDGSRVMVVDPSKRAV